MEVIQPVILSGGAGTRLWPASRSMFPKQLLPLNGEHTMLQQTVLRGSRRPDVAKEAMVICNEAHRFLVAEQLRNINVNGRIVVEPEGRNTAPAITLAALLLSEKSTNGSGSPLMLVMPADHVIHDVESFFEAVDVGTVAARNGRLVTFGVVPTCPHTGYGYIQSSAKYGEASTIDAFIEKPNYDDAISLLKEGGVFWNAGIFLFRADTYLEELEKLQPEIVRACREAMANARKETDFVWPDANAFRSSPSDSIDYAVMEKTQHAVMVPLDAGWTDVGDWSALHDVLPKDGQGNSVAGDVIALDCRNSYIRGGSRLVTAVGVSDLVIVEDKDSVLVTHRDKSQNVKQLVEELSRRGRGETKLHREVFRPWGSYDSIDASDGFQVKRLIVKPGAILSLQKHARRAEHWICVRGTARITRNDEEYDLHPNDSTYIEIGDIHRIANYGDEPVHIIEVQCGDYLGEDDIVRIEDNYGRQGTNT